MWLIHHSVQTHIVLQINEPPFRQIRTYTYMHTDFLVLTFLTADVSV